jgi:hypothetical protein
MFDFYPKDYSNFSISSEQFEEIFIQSFHIVSSHFGYETEEKRFRDDFLPFRKIGDFGSGATYFTDDIFDKPELYQLSLEVCQLKSFAFKNYKKPIVGRKLSLDQARSIAIMAASNVFFEVFQNADEVSRIQDNEFEDEIVADCVDEIVWQIYRNYYTDYRWTERQTKEILNQAIHIISHYGEDLLNDRGRFLDLNRAIYEGRANYVKWNPGPGNYKQTIYPLYLDKEYLISFKDKNYKSWKEPRLIKELKSKTNYGEWRING